MTPARVRPSTGALGRPRKVLLVFGVALIAAGVGIAVFGPRPATPVPEIAGAVNEDAPALRYVRSLPDAGDPLLGRPVGLALDSRHLYVADSGLGVVRVFSTDGPDAGEIGRDVLEVPTGVARDVAAGTLLVTDRGLGEVLRFGETGEPLGTLRPSADATRSWEPLGIAADGDGLVAVTDASGRHQVLLMDRAGRVERTFGGPLGADSVGSVVAALDFPNSVAFRADEIWVGDSNNRRVLVFGREGDLRRLVRVDGIARGITFIEYEDGWFAALTDALTSEIVLLDAEGAVAGRYGGPGVTSGRLAYPNDVIYDPATSQLFVADTGNARVQVWSVTAPGEPEDPVEAIVRRTPSAALIAGIIVAALGVMLIAAVVLDLSRQRSRMAALAANDELGRQGTCYSTRRREHDRSSRAYTTRPASRGPR